jgi:major type 1 subunit fimbrin (pilin)
MFSPLVDEEDIDTVGTHADDEEDLSRPPLDLTNGTTLYISTAKVSIMKKTLFAAALAATVGLASVAQPSHAADGTITFQGEVVDVTCDVTGGGGASGTGDLTVTLPKVAVSALAASGSTAGETPFSLNLSGVGCADGKTAQMFVETASSVLVDPATGNLRNGTPPGSGGADNVQVELLNPATNAQINLATNNNQPSAAIDANTATLNYVARYSATGTTTAGTVNSDLTYSMIYN